MKSIVILIIIRLFILKLENGIYIIKNLNNYFFSIEKNRLILSNIQTNFRLILIQTNLYYIETKFKRKRLGINDNNQIIKYYDIKNIDTKKLIWKISNLKDNIYLIQNLYNNKYIESNHNTLQCINKIYIKGKENLIFNYKFIVFKLAEEGMLIDKYIKKINKEPIDIIIKYIDLNDKELKRKDIKQIYKDNDNEELKYSIRSILQNIPWIRKIFILMPNEKVKFFKSSEEINSKIIYIKDKDFLGFDSANIHAFTFKLYFLRHFGVSNNFIYMEDDFFIGKSLKKTDFFYYDENSRKVMPYLVTKYCQVLNKSEIFNKYYDLFSKINTIHPHSYNGWWLSIYSTDKYIFEKYNINLVNTNFTHNVIPKNIDELKEIYNEIKDYKYLNETLFSKERNIMTLNQPHFWNLYQLNIKHRKINSISYKYISIEHLKNEQLNIPLFVINTGGNHIPTKRQYKIQKKIMNIYFYLPNIFELINKNKIFNVRYVIKSFIFAFNSFIILLFLKINNNNYYSYLFKYNINN